MNPDALAHLADALMEDIAATPSHQLAIEEIVDAGRSRELVFRFDDILAEASASSTDRPVTIGSRAIWNLTDALCEDIAAHPDQTVLTEISDDRRGDRSLAGKFDDILRRDRHLAMAGLRLPRQSGPSHLALAVSAALVQLLYRLIAPLHGRAAAGALATAAAAVLMTAVVFPPSRQTVEELQRIVTASAQPPKSPAQPAPSPVAYLAPPVVADGGNARTSATAGAPPPPAMAAVEDEKRVAAASPPARPAPPPVSTRGGNAGSAAESAASAPPPAMAGEGGEMRAAAISPEPSEPSLAARPGPPPVPASKAKAEPSVPPSAMSAGGGELRGAAAKRMHTAVAASPPSSIPAPAPEPAPRAAKPEAPLTARQGTGQEAGLETARAAQPGVGTQLTETPAETPAQPSALSAPRLSGDIETALKSLEEAARSGNVAALWKLGRMYADGDGVPQSHRRAFDYFRRIAEIHPTSVVKDAGGAKTRFIAGAFVELGRYYLTGIASSDIRPDSEHAREMFAHAAIDLADPDAQYHLGRMYLDGEGVAKNPKQGARWLYTAAAKGQYEAQAAFGSLLFKGGPVVPRDGAQGLMWLKIAMDAAPPGETRIAELYNAALRQATEEERAAALTMVEQRRNGQGTLTSEGGKPADRAERTRNPATRSQGAIGDGVNK